MQRFTDIADAAAALRSGGVLLLPTDTLPGLHACITRPEALQRISRAKQRSAGKPMLVLAASTEQALTLTSTLSDRQIELCRHCWPGPFSLILPAAAGLPEAITAQTAGSRASTLAVRVPDVPALCELIAATGAALASTSANRSGEQPLEQLERAVGAFTDTIDGWWRPESATASSDPVQTRAASALIDATTWPPRVLRPGPRPLPEI